MSSAHKAGKAILGLALLSSLMLTACAPVAQTNDSAPNPTAVASSASPSPTAKAYEYESNVFDATKQVSLTASTDPRNLYLGTGFVVMETDDKDVTTLAYTPYENPDKGWTYTSEVPLSKEGREKGGKANLMRWKGKSYIVLHGDHETKEAASGLNAATATSTEIVVVIDVETGKVANTLKGKPTTTTGGKITSDYSNSLFLLNDETVPDYKTGEVSLPTALVDISPYMTGLVFGTRNGQVAKLVDPLTGQDVATDTNHFQHYNEAGFFKVSETFVAKNYGYAGVDLKAVFGNYMLVAKTNRANNVSEYRLVNTVTKEVSPALSCGAQSGSVADPVPEIGFSPNFRYVNFYGYTVFDTETGKSFCFSPVDKPEVRPFFVNSIDNEGNMYGDADGEPLKVNIADTSKSEPLGGKGVAAKSIITDKGSLVVKVSKPDTGKEQNIVVIPAK